MNSWKFLLSVAAFLAFSIILLETPLRSRRGQERYFLPRLNIERAARVEVTGPGKAGTHVLFREGDRWLWGADLFSADPEAVKGLLDALYRLPQGVLASRSEAHYGVYAVTDETGFRIRVADAGNRAMADFYAGFPEGSLARQYLRLADSKEVYETGISLLSYLQRAPDEWKDSVVLGADPEGLDRIQISAPQSELTLERREEGWMVTEPTEYVPDRQALEAFLKALERVSAVGFATDEVDLSDPPYRLSLRGANLPLRLLAVGEINEEGLYPARNGESKATYFLKAATVKALFGSDFK